MPRVGLTTSEVVLAAAHLADQDGLETVTIAAVAGRLGVQPPALYRHIDGIGDLRRRIATLAMVDLGDELRDGLQGKAGRDALAALFAVVQGYVDSHPGRYAATTGERLGCDGDPLFEAATRVMGSFRATLSGYGIAEESLDHAIRMLRCTMHGYASLRAADAFQWSNDADETVAWMVAFFDTALGSISGRDRDPGRRPTT